MQNFGVSVVLTAHPTQFYPGAVLAIATDLKTAIDHGDVALSRDLLQQLGKTPFTENKNPPPIAKRWVLCGTFPMFFYPAVGELLDRIEISFPHLGEYSGQLIQLGFWPGGDRDGNPFVKVDTTSK